jgi:UDP-glucose 4-epimerase
MSTEGARDSTAPKCVVVGATGLIGRSLVEALAPRWEVHAVTRREPPTDEAVRWHRGDVSGDAGTAGLPASVDAVVYLAQSEFFREFPARAPEVFAVNTAGVVRLLDYARRAGARTFVFASSGGVYRPADAPLDGDAPLAPGPALGFYAATKLCGELLAQQYLSHFAVVLLRYFFVYGPGQRADMLMPRLTRSVRSGTPVVLQGPDGLRFNPTYVTDAARATCRAMTLRQSAAINVGGPEPVTLRAVCNEIGARVGCPPRFDVREPAAGPRDMVADVGAMTRLLGAPEVSVSQGIHLYLGNEES